MGSTEFKGVGLHDTAFRDAIREDSRQTTPSRGVTPRKKFAVEANVESRVKAASVQWQVTGGTAAQVGYAVYLVSAINSKWTSVADIAADAAALGNNTSGTLAKNGRVYTVAQQVANGTGITTDSMKVYTLSLFQVPMLLNITMFSRTFRRLFMAEQLRLRVPSAQPLLRFSLVSRDPSRPCQSRPLVCCSSSAWLALRSVTSRSKTQVELIAKGPWFAKGHFFILESNLRLDLT